MKIQALIGLSLMTVSSFAAPLKLQGIYTSESPLANSKATMTMAIEATTYEQAPREDGTLYSVKAAGTKISYDLSVTSTEQDLSVKCQMDVASRIGESALRLLKTNDGKLFVVQKSEISPYKDISVSISGLLRKHKCLNSNEVNYTLTLKDDVDKKMGALFRKKPMVLSGNAVEFNWGSYVCGNAWRIGYDFYCSSNAKGSFTIKNMLGTQTPATTNEIKTEIFYKMFGDGWVQRLVHFQTNEPFAIDQNLGWNRTELRTPVRFRRELWPAEGSYLDKTMSANFFAKAPGAELSYFEKVFSNEGYIVTATSTAPERNEEIYLKPKELTDGTIGWDHFYEGHGYAMTLRSLNGKLEVDLQDRGNGPDIAEKNGELIAFGTSARALKVTLPSGKILEPQKFRYSFYDYRSSPEPEFAIPTYFEVELNLPDRLAPEDCRVKENSYLVNYRDLKCNYRSKLKGVFLVKRIGEVFFLIGYRKDFDS